MNGRVRCCTRCDCLAGVEAEDDGLAHATDAIASPLEALLDRGGRQLPSSALERHVTELLAPFVAQAACLGSEG